MIESLGHTPPLRDVDHAQRLAVDGERHVEPRVGQMIHVLGLVLAAGAARILPQHLD